MVLFYFQIKDLEQNGDPRIALALAISLGFAMISPIKLGKIPSLSIKMGFKNNARLLFAIIVFISIIIWKGLVLFPILILYVLWSFINWIIQSDKIDPTEELSSVQDGD